jgi:hypothetical protein
VAAVPSGLILTPSKETKNKTSLITRLQLNRQKINVHLPKKHRQSNETPTEADDHWSGKANPFCFSFPAVDLSATLIPPIEALYDCKPVRGTSRE